jgi:hypothetical protein
MLTRISVITVVAVLVLTGIAYQHFPQDSWSTKPVSVATPPSRQQGGKCRIDGDSFAGVGWSINPATNDAVREAFDQAVNEQAGTPTLTMVYFNPQHDPHSIVTALTSGRRRVSKIFGETTHEGVVDATGLHTSARGVIGLACMRQPNMAVGVGGADFSEAPPRLAAKLALQRAVQDAGSTYRDHRPSMISLCVTLPPEEDVLAGLAEEVGSNIPLIGGTAAGSINALDRKNVSNWSIIANDRVIQNGVAIAVYYSDQPFGWSFGGGFRRTSMSGVVTKCKPRLILEIDGKPAADVYDRWLGGRVYEAMAHGADAAAFCSLYPISRYEGGNNQFIRAWPSEDPKFPGSLRTGSSVQAGDKIYLSEGDWNLLLNHFASVPRSAKNTLDQRGVASGLFIYCGGALACLPPNAREQMSSLVNQTMGDRPWLGVFTWGEQGNIPSVGNLHSNLSAGMVLFPANTKP